MSDPGTIVIIVNLNHHYISIFDAISATVYVV